MEVALVLLIKGDASVELLPDHTHVLTPHRLNAVVCDVGLAGGGHLVGDLGMEKGKWFFRTKKESLFKRLPYLSWKTARPRHIKKNKTLENTIILSILVI